MIHDILLLNTKQKKIFNNDVNFQRCIFLPVIGVEPVSAQVNFALWPSSVLILCGNWPKYGSSGSSSRA